ncbi:hypothetical protein D3C80_1703190 [compost metagenome]
MRSAVINPPGVSRPFLHHFLKAFIASSLLIEKGMTIAGASFPLKRSPRATAEPQKLQTVALVSVSVIMTAPQLEQ